MSHATGSQTHERRAVELLGLTVDCLTFDETVERCRALTADGGPHQHVVVNAAKVVAAHRDPELRAIINSCALVNADGVSVVWASKLLGRRLPERVTGVDLFQRLLAVAESDRKSVFFLGAQEHVLERLRAVVGERHPDLRIAGSHHGYWDADEEVIDRVRESTPDYLFLAIPSPRKEFWLREHLTALGVPFVMGVGGSFDVLAGEVRRAPVWTQRLGLEWLVRLLQEPRRMWRRYLFGNAAFLRLTLREWWRSRK